MRRKAPEFFAASALGVKPSYIPFEFTMPQLSAPTGFTVSADSGQASLVLNAVSGATGYQYRDE